VAELWPLLRVGQVPPLQQLQNLGVGSVRIGLNWSLIEPLPDRFDLADPRIQGWLDRAHAAGLHIFATLGDPPSWAAPCPSCMPYNLSDWYGYVFHVLAQFQYLGNDKYKAIGGWVQTPIELQKKLGAQVDG